jgi:hypothetical protein
MDKKFWHYIWTNRVRPIKVWYLVTLTVLSGLICVFALRDNYSHMDELREKVYTADQHNGDIVSALQDLQLYVTSHMNTDLAKDSNAVYPPIQLKYTYERLQAAAQEKAASANSQLYSDAQAYCERQNSTDFSGRNRVPCIEQYVTERGGAKAEPVPDDMYKFSFATPKWSADLAGISLVITIVLAAVTLLRILIGLILKRFTK